MKTKVLMVASMLAVAGAVVAQGVSVTPFANGETLRYEIVWPSGLRLGEAESDHEPAIPIK